MIDFNHSDGNSFVMTMQSLHDKIRHHIPLTEEAALPVDAATFQKFIKLTESQFVFWSDKLASVAGESNIGRSSEIYYWYLLTNILLHQLNGSPIEKNNTYSLIPGLEPHTTRSYVTKAGQYGLVETVTIKRHRYVRLSEPAKVIVMDTIQKWIDGFSSINRELQSH